MKKKYISPDILMTMLSVSNMICTSVQGGYDSGSISKEEEETLGSRGGGWDDDYDY